MKRSNALFMGILLFLTGCTEPESENQQDQPTVEVKEFEGLQLEVSNLEQQLLEMQQNVEVLEQMIMSTDGLGYGELRRNQQMLEDLILHLPDLEIRTGFIQKDDQNILLVDYAEKIESMDAPNGFEIVNESEESVELKPVEGLTIFVLNGTDLEARTIEEFNPSHHFFFEFYMSNGQLIQVRELYIP